MSTSSQPRTWIYARYSTDQQSQKSIDDQLSECRRLCAQNGWQVTNILTDAEMTGFISTRPGYQSLVRGIEAGEVDLIVAENIDRVVRDAEHSAKLEKFLTYYEVEFRTIQEGKVTAMQLAFKTMMSAEMRRTVALQVHRGLTGLVESGKNAGGLSFGYEIARDERGDRITGELCVVDGRAEIVRRIMTEFADGNTARKIAYDLNRDSIPSPSGGAWRQNTILGNSQRGTGVLNNELYVGIRVWNRLEYRLHPTTQKRVSRPRPKEQWVYCDVPHLKIVDDALWDRVKQRQMSLRRNDCERDGHEGKRAISRRSKFLLSGLLFCKCCGGKLTIAGTGERRYYYCQTAKQQGPSSCVGMTGLRQLDAEVAVLAGLRKDLMQPAAFEAFRQDYAAALKESVKGLGAEKEGLERSLKKLEKQIGNATSAILGGLNSPALLGELRKAEEQKADIVERLVRIDLPEPELPENLDRLYAERVRDLEAIIADPKLIQQAIDVMRLLVERIVVEERPEGGHLLDLQGNLARMLIASAPNRGWSSAAFSKSSLSLVAGGRIHLDRTTGNV